MAVGVIESSRRREDSQLGVTAQELLDRTRRSTRPACVLSAPKLERWLLRAGFAELGDDGLLRPTRLGKAVGGSFRQLDGGDPHPRTWVRRRT